MPTSGEIVGNAFDAWIMTLSRGLVVEGTAFYDSISFNEFWKIDPVRA
jgi:ketosteroid isomerase-like protein